MFSKLVVVILAVMGALATNPSPTCTTGPIQCCQSVQTANLTTLGQIASLIGGGVIVPLGTNVGFTCSPFTVIGGGSGSTCQGQTVCCENNSFNGLVAIGCSPINVIIP